MSDIGAQTRALWKDSSFTTRAHTRIRWTTAPFALVEKEIPASGAILEIGCGHGLFSQFLALSSPQRMVTGCDLDGEKIAEAKETSKSLTNLSFIHNDGATLPDGPWDAIVIVDVLYLLDEAAQKSLLVNAQKILRPGGIIVIKELDVTPAWKFQVAKFQEVLATKVLRITKGSSLTFRSLDDIAADLAPLKTSVQRIDRGYVHPHVLVTARS
ncbi:MAG: hypothetical protein RLZZ31_1370 [Actinomycetota bacterium]